MKCTAIEQPNAAGAQQTGEEAIFSPSGLGMTGGRRVEVKFEFRGRLAPDSFQAFARRRASRLSLELDEGDASASRFVCRVRGPLALVDAFEMACSLGPLDCLVMETAREDEGILT